MYGQISRTHVVSAALCLAFPLPVGAQKDPIDFKLLEVARSELRQNWEHATATPFVSTCSQRLAESGPGGRVMRKQFQARLRGQSFVQTEEILSAENYSDTEVAERSKQWPSFANGRNSKYEFQLTRKFGAKEWALLGCKIGNETSESSRPLILRPGFFPAMQHLAILGTPLHEAMSDTGWTTQSTTPIDGRTNLIRIDFDWDFTFPFKTELKYNCHGWVVLDRATGFCIESADYTKTVHGSGKPYSTQTAVKNQRFASEHGIFVLLKNEVSETRTDSNGNVAAVQLSQEFRTTYDRDLSESEFTLTSFGLPEPAGMKWERPIPKYRWFLDAAALCAISAIGLRLFVRHRGRPS